MNDELAFPQEIKVEMPHVENFLKYLQIYKDSADATIVNYRIDLREFFTFTEGEYRLKTVTMFRDYTAWLLKDKQRSRKTIHRRLSSLKSYYHYLYNENIIQNDLADKIKYIKLDPPTAKEVMERKNVIKILEKITDVRDRALLETLYSTGCRESELSKLDIINVDFENELVSIIKSKRGKTRVIPISGEALKWIKAYLGVRKNGPLFLNNRAGRLGTKTIYNLCKHYFELPPHDLRHAFASHMLEATGNLKAVADMLGDTEDVVKKVYIHLNAKSLSRIYKDSGAMDR